MTRITYIGPHEAVELAMPSGQNVVVERGESLETTPDHAAALCDQATNWQPAKAPPRTTAPKAPDTNEEGT